MELTLFSPAITCEKCIEHIEVEIASVSGARFLSGEPKSKSFSVSITRGDVLDAISSVLTESGYPLGPAIPAISSEIQSEDYTPSPVVVPSECGATISLPARVEALTKYLSSIAGLLNSQLVPAATIIPSSVRQLAGDYLMS